MPQLLRILIPLFVLFAVASDGALAAPRSQSVEVDRVVAVVNSDAITLQELRSRLASVERQLRAQKVQLPPSEVLQRQILERMIIERIQMDFARESGLMVSDGELDAALRRIAESNHLALADFKAALEKDGVAWSRFREEIRQEMIIARLRDREVDSRLVISDGEVDNYLASPERAAAEELVQLQHIIIRVPEQADNAQIARFRARAEQAWQQIRQGDEFGRVAASFSDAPDGLQGGVMDPRPMDRLPGLYAEAVKGLKPGEVSGILRSPAGFHIVKLLERQGAAMPTKAIRQTHARHILIKVNELVSEAEARRRIESLKERLDNGADFAELAKLHSNDISATKGGDLGWLYEGDTVPEFEKAMDALKLKEISGPVRSPFGYHLIQVLERRTEDASADRQRLIARQALKSRKSDEAYQDWLRQLRDRAYVEYRLEEK